MKNTLTKRLFSILLCAVLLLSALPLTPLTAHAAGGSKEISGFDQYGITISSFYLKLPNDSISYTIYNYKDSSQFSERVKTFTYIASATPVNGKVTVTYDLDFAFESGTQVTTQGTTEMNIDCTHTANQPHVISFNDGYQISVTYSKTAVSHSYTWTSKNNSHTGTCTKCGKIVTGKCSGDPGATCSNPGKCTTCSNAYYAPDAHDWKYRVDADNAAKIIAECACGENAYAELKLTVSEANIIYTGEAHTPLSVIKSANWPAASTLPSVIQYENNVHASNNTYAETASGSITFNGLTIKKDFFISKASITEANVTLAAESAVYTGEDLRPTIHVAVNDSTLTQDSDYTVGWDKSPAMTPGNYKVTVNGDGNYTGTVEKTFTVDEASLTNVSVQQTGTLTYTGESLTPTVSTNAVSVNGQPISFKYSTAEDGKYSEALPNFEKAGTYTVYYKVSAPYHTEVSGSFKVTVNKAVVEAPTLESKVYTGDMLYADVPESPLYTVERNGFNWAGTHNVQLTLTDPENYKWETSDSENIYVPFEIDQAENYWVTEPSVENWTYGDTTRHISASPAFGSYDVTYSGTLADGTEYASSSSSPWAAGDYTAHFTVKEHVNYTGLSCDVSFKVLPKTVTFDTAIWNYTGPFRYDGYNHTVGLNDALIPAGPRIDHYENEFATDAGSYHAVAYLRYDDKNYTGPEKLELDWAIVNDWTPVKNVEYTVTEPNENGWANGPVTLYAAEGYTLSLTNTADDEWHDILTFDEEAADGCATFYVRNNETKEISLAANELYKIDTTPPTGKVSLDERNEWESFIHDISFGIFYPIEVTVNVTAADNLSGIAQIEYAASDKALTLEEVKALTDWTVFTESFGVTLEDAKRFVYFIRLTDKAGNISYLSTDGAVYDTVNPVISGIKNGGTYYTTQKFSVSDINLGYVAVNEMLISDPSAFVLPGNTEAEYVVYAADLAGNATSFIVHMKPIRELAKATENRGNDNVTSDDAPALEELVKKLDELIADPDTSDDGEKETLEQHKVIAVSLLKSIEEAAKAADTENTAKTGAVTVENVKLEDKEALKAAKADLEKALETYGTNYTVTEKEALFDDIARIEAAIKVVENAEPVAAMLKALPETADIEDDETVALIREAKKAFDLLSDSEKALISAEHKEKLAALLNEIEYRIIKGDGGMWTVSGETGLTFTANGPFKKFVGIAVNGKEVDKKHYDAKAGSTVVTLKNTYLKTLSKGEYELAVVYTDGAAQCSFEITGKPDNAPGTTTGTTTGTATGTAKPNNPATGDSMNLAAFGSLFAAGLMSLTGLIPAVKKKRK